MGMLCWDKPKRARDPKEHADISFDGGPPGGYVPNMSAADRKKWKAKLVGHNAKPPHPQVEIRKDSFVIIVSLGDGYVYKSYGKPREYGTVKDRGKWFANTKGYQVHLASAGPIRMTFKEFEQMLAAVQEAREYLHDKLWEKK